MGDPRSRSTEGAGLLSEREPEIRWDLGETVYAKSLFVPGGFILAWALVLLWKHLRHRLSRAFRSPRRVEVPAQRPSVRQPWTIGPKPLD